ncbi:MAG: VWA domain-containing protein [Gemmataceae bacterium]|nr:VWA domain-containing protein [Gemmataceae bacterium]
MRAIPFVLLLCYLGAAGSGCKDSRKEANSTFTNTGSKLAAEKPPVVAGRTIAPAATPTSEKTTLPFITDGDIEPLTTDVGTGADKKSVERPIVDTIKIVESITKDVDKAISEPSPKIEIKKDGAPAAVAEAVVGKEHVAPRKPKQQPIPSGILTAGSFDDNVEPHVFASFAKRSSQKRELGNLTTLLGGHRLTVLVKDPAGKPVGNARVKLSGGAASAVELITRSDGRAVFVLSFDQLPDDQPLVVNVTGPTGGTPITESVAVGANRWEVTLPTATSQFPKTLDFAIVLDTTGSMGDEIRHLAAEIRGISAAIAKNFPEVKQRFALILYRDDNDAYVVRTFDFTESLDEFQKNIAAQSAAGGGDYPEAVHRGLEAAGQLRWSEGPHAARVAFLIADAPPHAQHMNRTMKAANVLRSKGVALYPVACSGYDAACEFVMRACAMFTGSRFLFLTDDSGVGSAHAEPSIPYYQVERLERLMIRMVASELSGRVVPAEAGDIIRTVGKKVN